MTPARGDDEPSINPHDGARTPGVRSRAGDHVEIAHDRCQISLTVAEQRCFDEIVAPMWALRITRGRRSSIFGREWSCLMWGVVGIVGSIVALGTLPLAVSFAGFTLALVAFVELSQQGARSGWWRWTRRSLDLPATLWQLLVVVVIVACASVVRAARRIRA